MNNQPAPAQIGVLAAGGILLVASFLPWISSNGISLNAWGSVMGISFFPIYTFPALLGLLAAGSLALTLFASVSLPERILTFTWPQLHAVAGLWASLTTGLVMFGDTEGLAIGYWLSLLASLGLLVAGFLETREAGPSAAPSAPPQAF